MNDLLTDLAADLAADLERPAPLPSPGMPSPGTVTPPTAPAPTERGARPAVAVVLTPLRWSRPAVGRTEHGTGLAVRLGPWRIEVAL